MSDDTVNRALYEVLARRMDDAMERLNKLEEFMREQKRDVTPDGPFVCPRCNKAYMGRAHLCWA